MANNIAAKQLIETAYDIQGFQILGGPKWLDSTRYDIVAKAEDSSDKDPRRMSESERKLYSDKSRLRLQSLLAARFNLQCHSATKEGSVYALVVAKNGSKLKPSRGEAHGPNRGMRMRPGQLDAQAASISFLARSLSAQLGRTVVDKTGLSGLYDFTLQWTPEQREGQMFKGPGSGPEEHGDAPPPPDGSGPSVFTAVQEQLGLKLESQKGPVEMLVIDHVEPPSEN